MKIINKYKLLFCIAIVSSVTYCQNTCIFSEKGINPITKFCFNNDNYKSAFFLGENHEYRSADDLAIHIFKKLKAECNVKTYCFEGGKSSEYLYYYFLNNGTFKSKYKNSDLNLFRKKFINNFLKPLTNEFKTDSSLKFISFDIETNLNNSLAVSNQILLESNTNNVFEKLIDIIQIPCLKSEKKYNQCRYLVNAFHSDTLKFFENMKLKNYNYLKSIISGIKSGVIFDSLISIKKYSDAFNYREKQIYLNIKSVIMQNPKSNVLIQIGINHILSKIISKDIQYFESLLNLNIEKVDFSIIKIGCVYSKVKTLSNYWLVNKYEIKEINKITKNKYSYYNIENSKGFKDQKINYMIFCK